LSNRRDLDIKLGACLRIKYPTTAPSHASDGCDVPDYLQMTGFRVFLGFEPDDPAAQFAPTVSNFDRAFRSLV
jgi:hypothetical protein